MTSLVVPREDDRFIGSSDQLGEGDNASTDGLSSRSKAVIAVAVIMAVLAAMVVGLRTYCRRVFVRRVGKDDWAIIVALVFSIGDTVGMCIQSDTALGRHMADLTPEEVILYLKEAYYTMISYNLGLVFAKVSILLLYLRIFGVAHPTLRKTAHYFLVVVSVLGAWLVCAVVFFCWPIEASWDLSVTAKCMPRKMRWYLGPTVNIVTDLMIIALPLPVIYKMRLPRTQKIGVCMAFAAGFLVCIIAFVRLGILVRDENTTDPSYDLTTIAICSIVEVNMAIICPCIVTLRPLVSRIHRRHPATVPNSGSREVHLTAGPEPGAETEATVESNQSWLQKHLHGLASITTSSRSDSTATTSTRTAEQGDGHGKPAGDIEVGVAGSSQPALADR